jgi:hypothetical protein
VDECTPPLIITSITLEAATKLIRCMKPRVSLGVRFCLIVIPFANRTGSECPC